MAKKTENALAAGATLMEGVERMSVVMSAEGRVGSMQPICYGSR